MISCTEFITAYSELFCFIEERHGRAALVRFWEELADEFLHNLRDLVAEKGLAGMHEYWTHTLTEEGAEHTLTLTEEEFSIDMRRCPSVAVLRANTHLKTHPNYCEHCQVLYKRVIEPFGYRFRLDVHDPTAGRCTLRVTSKE